jgi:hypothetical protein
MVFDLLTDAVRTDMRLFGLVLFLMLLAATEIGLFAGRWAARRRPVGEPEKTATGFVAAGMLGLLAFLLGITLSIASSHYEARRQSVLAEANAIGTAWLRIQTVAGEEARPLRDLLRDYTQVRIDVIDAYSTPESAATLNARSNALQTRLWQEATKVAQRAPTPISGLLLSSLNDMFDMATTSRRDFTVPVPPFLLRILMVASLLGVGAMGYQFGVVGTRQQFIAGLLLLVWTLSITLVIDVDTPRSGGVTVSTEPLHWTQQGFGPPEPP